jgi:hypothetical protein
MYRGYRILSCAGADVCIPQKKVEMQQVGEVHLLSTVSSSNVVLELLKDWYIGRTNKITSYLDTACSV